MTTPLPKHSTITKVAKTAVSVASRPLHLGVLLESSEYEIQLPHTEYQTITGALFGCAAIIQNQTLKIITHELNSIWYQELTIHGITDCQKISFFIVPNLFDLSCKA